MVRWRKITPFQDASDGRGVFFAHDQACGIVQDAINNKEQKFEKAAKDPRTKRCLQRSHKRNDSRRKNRLTQYEGN